MKLFKKAILIVHGFAGGVYDQEILSHELELIWNYDVYTFTLPGHERTLFKHVTREDWINSCEEHINMIIKAGYKKKKKGKKTKKMIKI